MTNKYQIKPEFAATMQHDENEINAFNMGTPNAIQKYADYKNKPKVEVQESEQVPTTMQMNTGNNPKDYTNHSGGAYGGDTYWDKIGREFGVTEHKHYRDSGNTKLSKKLTDANVQAEVLSSEQMEDARTKIEQLLGKKFPNTTEGNLQVRNYYQVANSDAVFAIATIKDGDNVKGGTNTAVRLGIQMDKPVYVWDTATEKWYRWDDMEGFTQIRTVPTLTKNFAGVGTRDIEDYHTLNKTSNKWESRKEYLGIEKENAAKQAIRDVYEKTFGNKGNKSLTQDQIAFLGKLGVTEEQYNKLNKEEQDRLFGCN